MISYRSLLSSTIVLNDTINNDYTRYYICSAWFLDIIISTCSGYYYFRPVLGGGLVEWSVRGGMGGGKTSIKTHHFVYPRNMNYRSRKPLKRVVTIEGTK